MKNTEDFCPLVLPCACHKELLVVVKSDLGQYVDVGIYDTYLYNKQNCGWAGRLKAAIRLLFCSKFYPFASVVLTKQDAFVLHQYLASLEEGRK